MQLVTIVNRLAQESEWKLMEKLCCDVGSEVFAACDIATLVNMSVRKAIVPQADAVSVTVSLERD